MDDMCDITFSWLLAGVTSILMEPRSEDHNPSGLNNWNILSLKHWGEEPAGQWKIEIIDTVSYAQSFICPCIKFSMISMSF